MWRPDREDEPCINDVIYLLDATGKPDGRRTKVLRTLSEERDAELWEVVDKLGRTRIVTAGATVRQWIEVQQEY